MDLSQFLFPSMFGFCKKNRHEKKEKRERSCKVNEKETKDRQNYKREKVNSRLFFTKSFESSDIYFSFIQQIKRLGKNTDKQTVKKSFRLLWDAWPSGSSWLTGCHASATLHLQMTFNLCWQIDYMQVGWLMSQALSPCQLAAVILTSPHILVKFLSVRGIGQYEKNVAWMWRKNWLYATTLNDLTLTKL